MIDIETRQQIGLIHAALARHLEGAEIDFEIDSAAQMVSFTIWAGGKEWVVALDMTSEIARQPERAARWLTLRLQHGPDLRVTQVAGLPYQFTGER